VSDTNQGGTPPENPYGGQNPAGQNPYGQPAGGQQPYGQPSRGEQPFGQPPADNPYGQAPYAQQPQQPYGPPPAASPYAQPPQYAAPYGHQPPAGPLGDGLDMYGRPLGNDSRPATVTAAGWITLILSGLTALLYGFITLAMVVAKDEVLREINRALAEQGSTGEFDAEDAFGFVVVVLVVLTLWCVITCVLAVFALRRSNVSRILLVISATVAGVLSLFGIKSVISGVWLLACLAVVVMLFTGGANDWYARRRRF
jgi:hypothetical protein